MQLRRAQERGKSRENPGMQPTFDAVGIRNSTVSGNARFGIGLELHSGVLFDDPPASVVGNTQAQVACRESTSKYDGNLSGVGQPIFCTAF